MATLGRRVEALEEAAREPALDRAVDVYEAYVRRSHEILEPREREVFDAFRDRLVACGSGEAAAELEMTEAERDVVAKTEADPRNAELLDELARLGGLLGWS